MAARPPLVATPPTAQQKLAEGLAATTALAETHHSVMCPLPACPESAKAARDLTTRTLREWGMGDLCDNVGLVVSELVTNALRHAVPSDAESSDVIRLRLVRTSPYVLCGVEDPSERAPVRRPPDIESGRGLQIVQSVSRRWGWGRLRRGGKIVWAWFLAANR